MNNGIMLQSLKKRNISCILIVRLCEKIIHQHVQICPQVVHNEFGACADTLNKPQGEVHRSYNDILSVHVVVATSSIIWYSLVRCLF